MLVCMITEQDKKIQLLVLPTRTVFTSFAQSVLAIFTMSVSAVPSHVWLSIVTRHLQFAAQHVKKRCLFPSFARKVSLFKHRGVCSVKWTAQRPASRRCVTSFMVGPLA